MPPRGTAFGVCDTGFGTAWFLGSWPMGVLYDVFLTGLIIFSVLFQLASLPLFLMRLWGDPEKRLGGNRWRWSASTATRDRPT